MNELDTRCIACSKGHVEEKIKGNRVVTRCWDCGEQYSTSLMSFYPFLFFVQEYAYPTLSGRLRIFSWTNGYKTVKQYFIGNTEISETGFLLTLQNCREFVRK